MDRRVPSTSSAPSVRWDGRGVSRTRLAAESRRRDRGAPRVVREAQTLAALNHPNIGQIFGLQDLPGSDGSRALVMELVDGDDLSALIARGPVAFADALPIARQIADALEAAHEQGIVRRDLKPANVKLRPDGTVFFDYGGTGSSGI